MKIEGKRIANSRSKQISSPQCTPLLDTPLLHAFDPSRNATSRTYSFDALGRLESVAEGGNRDTVLGTLEDPRAHNLYLYLQNDPLNNIDPSGHQLVMGGSVNQTLPLWQNCTACNRGMNIPVGRANCARCGQPRNPDSINVRCHICRTLNCRNAACRPQPRPATPTPPGGGSNANQNAGTANNAGNKKNSANVQSSGGTLEIRMRSAVVTSITVLSMNIISRDPVEDRFATGIDGALTVTPIPGRGIANLKKLPKGGARLTTTDLLVDIPYIGLVAWAYDTQMNRAVRGSITYNAVVTLNFRYRRFTNERFRNDSQSRRFYDRSFTGRVNGAFEWQARNALRDAASDNLRVEMKNNGHRFVTIR